MMTSFATIITGVSEYEPLRLFMLSASLSRYFDPKIISYLIKSDQRRSIEKFLPMISSQLVERPTNGEISEDKTSALYSMIFYHYPESVSSILPDAFKYQTQSLDLTCELVENALLAFEKAIQIDQAAMFWMTTPF